MAENVGAIYYTVEARTAALLEAEKGVSRSMDSMASEMGKADKAADKLNTQMTKTAAGVRQANSAASQAHSAFGGLYKVLAAYIGMQTVKSLVSLSDEYGQMASRVRQVTADTAEYEAVQARLLATANATYRPLAEAQEVFIRTADSLRDLGYNTEQALDVTDSFSFLLVTNAASADRAKSAIDAYSKSIQTGKVNSDQWQSILAAMPTVVDGIAEATGRSREEIKKLGVEGRLSLNALNEGLRRSRDENEALAAEMETSVQDSFTALRNSLQVFVGKVNESSGATGILTAAVGDLATILQDPETIRAAQELAAGVVTALGKIIEGAKETVGFVRWMADEVAAALHGASQDDVVRLEEQMETWQAMLDNPLRRGRITLDGVKIYSEDEIRAQLEAHRKAIDEFYAREQQRPKLSAPVDPPPKPDPKDAQVVEAEAAATEKKTRARVKLTDAEKEARTQTEELRRAQEGDALTLERLREELFQTTLSAEDLRDRKAELSLSKFATPEQIEEVKQLNAELQKTEDIQKRKAAFGDGSVRDKIVGAVSPLSGGQFDDQTARYEAEAAAEMQRYADQQKRLEEALELQLVTKTEYDALQLEMYQANSDRMAQIDKARMEVQLASWSQGFGSMASSLQAFAATFASENREMFAMAKAAAIAQAVINTYQAATGAMAAMSAIPIVGPALGIAAAAAAVAGGMAQVAQIRSQSMGGGRQYGGPVASGSMYRINENGAPEVFNAANGRQYMLPNTRGEVVSNADATAAAATGAGSAQSLNVTQNIYMNDRPDNRTLKQMQRESYRQQAKAKSRLG